LAPGTEAIFELFRVLNILAKNEQTESTKGFYQWAKILWRVYFKALYWGAQKWVWIEPKYFIGSPRKAASDLWRDKLLGLGVELMRETISDITNGKFIRIPQQADVSTWEPSTDVNDIFRPDLLMLPPPTKSM
jgi:hypothetical protein